MAQESRMYMYPGWKHTKDMANQDLSLPATEKQ